MTAARWTFLVLALVALAYVAAVSIGRGQSDGAPDPDQAAQHPLVQRMKSWFGDSGGAPIARERCTPAPAPGRDALELAIGPNTPLSIAFAELPGSSDGTDGDAWSFGRLSVQSGMVEVAWTPRGEDAQRPKRLNAGEELRLPVGPRGGALRVAAIAAAAHAEFALDSRR